ncbi:phage tail tube protein [Paracoccus sp. (in: a-proteobacteria)]|uniref:phage tail tube protein n=1 Tax=Paracoccus sp. TaxID=267 RepID=UPI004058FECB
MANIGYGTTVEVGVGETPVWTALAGVKDVSLPDSQVDEVEVTSMDSPNRTREYIAGLNDNGEVSMDMNYVPLSPTDVLLRDIKASGETVQIRFSVPNEANTAAPYVETYAGFCKGYGRTAPVGDAMMATATFRISAEIIE